MNKIIEDNDDQFANGQSGRDLRVSSDAELETQLVEALGSSLPERARRTRRPAPTLCVIPV